MSTITVKHFHELSIVGAPGLPMVYANNNNTGERITIPIANITALHENPPEEGDAGWRPPVGTNHLILHTHAGTFVLRPVNNYGDEWVDDVGTVWDLFVGRSRWNGYETVSP